MVLCQSLASLLGCCVAVVCCGNLLSSWHYICRSSGPALGMHTVHDKSMRSPSMASLKGLKGGRFLAPD